MKLNRCLSEQSQGPMVIVSGNDTAAGIFTGNLPSRLILQTSYKIQKVILGTFLSKDSMLRSKFKVQVWQISAFVC